jgi:mono/diheme cytochrome c family protein
VGGGASGGTGGHASPVGAGAGPSPANPPLTRAEAERNYEKLQKEFPQEASVNQNPSKARAAAKARTFESTEGMNGYDVVSEKYQPSRSLESEMAGKKLYLAMCRRCHAEDGSPVEENAALSRYNMANLSDPMQYKYGADGRGIFRSIAFGTKAPPHGTYNGILSDEQIWNIVAYLQSIQNSR